MSRRGMPLWARALEKGCMGAWNLSSGALAERTARRWVLSFDPHALVMPPRGGAGAARAGAFRFYWADAWLVMPLAV